MGSMPMVSVVGRSELAIGNGARWRSACFSLAARSDVVPKPARLGQPAAHGFPQSVGLPVKTEVSLAASDASEDL